jgi:lipoyl-dependent peroxiredoxin
MAVLYEAEATARGGREGHVRSSDGAVDLPLVIPKELGGSGGRATNPEQLFAAGYAACFENALRHVARGERLRIYEASVTARVGIGPDEAGGFKLSVELHVRVPDLEKEDAERIVARAHEVCPYSNATRGNIDVKLVIEPAPAVI